MTDTKDLPADLINSDIVDKFVKAIEAFRDPGDSKRSCYRHGLEQIAAEIVARSQRLTAPLGPEVEEIEARLGAATPGPWEAHEGLDYVKIISTSMDIDVAEWSTYGAEAQPFVNPDADLIAHAPTDIRFLIDRLRAEVAGRGMMPEEIPPNVLDAACAAFVNGKEGEGSKDANRYAKPMRRVYVAIRAALTKGEG